MNHHITHLILTVVDLNSAIAVKNSVLQPSLHTGLNCNNELLFRRKEGMATMNDDGFSHDVMPSFSMMHVNTEQPKGISSNMIFTITNAISSRSDCTLCYKKTTVNIHERFQL